MNDATPFDRIDLWFHITTDRGGRTYHRTVGRATMLDELKAKLAGRANLAWFHVDAADLDTIEIDYRPAAP
jgi:hypothetical protein